MSDFLARPWLLITAPVIFWVLWQLLRSANPTSWADFLPPELAKRLLTQNNTATSAPLLIKRYWVLGLLTLFFTLAFAGVGYVLKADQLPGEQQELVVIQYLSPLMRGNAAPQRQLDTSKRVLIPLLNARKQGKTALIYYAGSAHLVSPMSDDTATLRQLYSLTNPSVMPLGGQKPDTAFRLAASLGKLSSSNKQGSLDWLWLTDKLPSEAALLQLLQLKPKRAQLYLIWLDATLARVEKEQAAFAGLGVTLLHPDQLADSTAKLNKPTGGRGKENQQGIRFFQELSHWPLLAGLLLLLWQYFGQPRLKQPSKLRFWSLALLLSILGISVQQPVEAASWQNLDYQARQAIQAGEGKQAQKLAIRTDLKAYAEFLLGNYEKAAELFADWQAENLNADEQQQAEMLFNTGTAWLLAEKHKAALDSFELARELQPEWLELCFNRKLAELQLAGQEAPTEQELLEACGASSGRSSDPSDDLEDETEQPKDWQPEENTSCEDCGKLDPTEEKQLQHLQEDPWRLLKYRFKSELKEQQP